ncbi:MAG: glycosyltransferase [Candidatus Pacearchaeota archaeon]
MKKIAIIIPAYNEEKRIGPTLESYASFFDKIALRKEFDTKIHVVINNTTDKTEEIVKKYAKKYTRISYIDLLQGGKGYAVITGFKEMLRKDFALIGFVDADMATAPEEFYKLIKKMNGYDGAIADRYLPTSRISPKPSIGRLIAKRLFNFLIRSLMLLPFGDTQCGAKIFKREALAKVINQLSMSQWAFDVELLYHLNALGYRINAVPTKWVDKKYSTINFWSAGPLMALGVLRLRILNSPFRRFMKIHDKLIGFIPK